MSWLKIDNRYFEAEQWLTVGPIAQSLHLGAMAYCDRQLNGGRLPKAMVSRVSTAVRVEEAEAAVSLLLEHGLWVDHLDAYLIPEHAKVCMSAEEQEARREQWNLRSRRKRLHDLGDHSICTSHCKEKSRRDTQRESHPNDTTGPDATGTDPTGPDPTEGEGRVQEEGPALHPYLDDGSGASCETCGLPEAHDRHVRVVLAASA